MLAYLLGSLAALLLPACVCCLLDCYLRGLSFDVPLQRLIVMVPAVNRCLIDLDWVTTRMAECLSSRLKCSSKSLMSKCAML